MKDTAAPRPVENKKIFIESLAVCRVQLSFLAENMRRLVLTMIKATKIMIPRAYMCLY